MLAIVAIIWVKAHMIASVEFDLVHERSLQMSHVLILPDFGRNVPYKQPSSKLLG